MYGIEAWKANLHFDKRIYLQINWPPFMNKIYNKLLFYSGLLDVKWL